MNPLGLEYLTLYGMHPLEFIRTAAAAGASHISLFARPLAAAGTTRHPPMIHSDAGLRRDMRSCLDDHGISIGMMDCVSIVPDQSVEALLPMFDLLGPLGITRINILSIDSWERTVDQLGLLTEIAARYDVTVTMETFPLFTIGTLSKALALIDQLGMPNLKLLIDTMHVTRAGDADMVPDIDPALIEYVQLCDGAVAMPTPQAYFYEAVNERALPGEGEMPLVAMLRNLRPGVIVSPECPMRKRRLAGMSGLDRAKLAVDAARRTLVEAGS